MSDNKINESRRCLPARKQRRRSKHAAKEKEEDSVRPPEKSTSVRRETVDEYRDSAEHIRSP